MIDTLQLVVKDYDASDADLELQPATINVKSGTMNGNFPLYKSGARMIEGRKAFNNEGPCRLTIKAIPARDERGMQPLCTVALEVPKVAADSNYHPTDAKGAEEALQRVQRHLSDIGFKCNILDAQPARVDAFRNMVADEPYSCYSSVLKLLSGSRMEKRGYENGFLWENTRQQLIAYDKLQKMIRDKLSVAGLPPNTIRFEMRLINSQKVRDTLSVTTARELLEHYDDVARVYRATMEKQLFCHTVNAVETMFASDVEAQLRQFRAMAGRNWVAEWVTFRGWQDIQRTMSMETLLGVIEKLEVDKNQLSRVRYNMKKARFDTETMRSAGPSKRTTGQLYEEMREKVLVPLGA
jgi:hypothetical protein